MTAHMILNAPIMNSVFSLGTILHPPRKNRRSNACKCAATIQIVYPGIALKTKQFLALGTQSVQIVKDQTAHAKLTKLT
jgi:hypothetical protein